MVSKKFEMPLDYTKLPPILKTCHQYIFLKVLQENFLMTRTLLSFDSVPLDSESDQDDFV